TRSIASWSSTARASATRRAAWTMCPAARSQGWISGSAAPTSSTPAWRRRTEWGTPRLSWVGAEQGGECPVGDQRADPVEIRARRPVVLERPDVLADDRQGDAGAARGRPAAKVEGL